MVNTERYQDELAALDERAGYAWERLTKFAVGPHSYRTHDDSEDLLDDAFIARPPGHGDTKEEYHEYMTDLLTERHDRIEQIYDDAREDGARFRDAARVQKDESIYMLARSTMFVSGMGGVLSGQFWGMLLGAPAVMSGPLGVGNAYTNITEMQDEGVLEDEMELYAEAIDELEDTGLDALPDDVDETVRTPGVGKKNIGYSFDGQAYQREFTTPSDAARSLYSSGQIAIRTIAGRTRSFFDRS